MPGDGVGALELEREAPLAGQKPRAKPKATAAVAGRPTREPPVAADTLRRPTIVVARPPAKARSLVGDVELTHPDRSLWPGISKQDLAADWLAVAPRAVAGLSRRPLSIVRCPDGVGGKQHFYQKSGHGYMPSQIREGQADGQPYLSPSTIRTAWSR